MSNIPTTLKYTTDHEWLRHESDGQGVIGITDHAQDSLGDITFVELPNQALALLLVKLLVWLNLSKQRLIFTCQLTQRY